MLLRLLAAGTLTSLLWCQALEEGKRAFDAGKYAVAARLFEKARQESHDCHTLLYLGLARYRLKQLDPALMAFQEAVQCDPKLVTAHLALGEAYAEAGNDTEAVTAYQRVLRIEPTNAEALRGAAAIYARDKLDEKAAGVLEALIKVDPSNSQAHADFGAAYFALGNHDAAEAQFQEALRL